MQKTLDLITRQINSHFTLFYKHLFRHNQIENRTGINRPHLEVLKALKESEDDKEHVSSSKLASRLLVSKAYMTALTEKLVKEGYIKRIPSIQDRRVIHIALTAEGRNALESIEAGSREIWKARLSRLSEEDLKTLSTSLENIRRILREIPIDN